MLILVMDLGLEENFDDLPLINLLRLDVRRWRESDYRGATNVSALADVKANLIRIRELSTGV
jgi:hypothetical protein